MSFSFTVRGENRADAAQKIRELRQKSAGNIHHAVVDFIDHAIDGATPESDGPVTISASGHLAQPHVHGSSSLIINVAPAPALEQSIAPGPQETAIESLKAAQKLKIADLEASHAEEIKALEDERDSLASDLAETRAALTRHTEAGTHTERVRTALPEGLARTADEPEFGGVSTAESEDRVTSQAGASEQAGPGNPEE